MESIERSESAVQSNNGEKKLGGEQEKINPQDLDLDPRDQCTISAAAAGIALGAILLLEPLIGAVALLPSAAAAVVCWRLMRKRYKSDFCEILEPTSELWSMTLLEAMALLSSALQRAAVTVQETPSHWKIFNSSDADTLTAQITCIEFVGRKSITTTLRLSAHLIAADEKTLVQLNYNVVPSYTKSPSAKVIAEILGNTRAYIDFELMNDSTNRL